MRIRSLGQLDEYLDTELSRRKRELTTLKFTLDNRRQHEKELLIRAGICILYAHWEGFIKSAATAYVSFVETRGLKYRDLAANFVALGLRGEIEQAGVSHSRRIQTALTARLMSGLGDRASFDVEHAVDTRSNLNSESLSEIVSVLGISDADYLLDRQRIDQKLVKKRNGIAHGEFIQVDADEYTELHDLVLRLVEKFRIDVGNAAATEDYRRIRRT